jgi:hypothetical protein
MIWLLPGPRRIGDVSLDIHTLLYAVVAAVMFPIRTCGNRGGKESVGRAAVAISYTVMMGGN